ncbi:MAG: SDR family oxidoreductase [Chloroflexota bacterium]|nr:SDR family oxidoreductase [Chloroflexota bacterium]
MDLGLRDKVAVITGSSRGLGKASALALAREGARVVLNGRTEATLRQAADEIRAEGGNVATVAADVSADSGCQALVDGALSAFGQIDILVNNAGGGTPARIASPDSDWAAAIDWMFWPSLRLTRMVTPAMRERKWGVVIMMASIYGRELGGSSAYQVAKTAQISLAKTLAKELAPDNIRVLSVAPGSISFPGGSWWRRQEQEPEAMARFVAQEMPLGRFGRAEEVGDVVAFLCSERASLVTGVSLPVDGCQSRSLI